jgi:hypothetical protein
MISDELTIDYQKYMSMLSDICFPLPIILNSKNDPYPYVVWWHPAGRA